MKIIFLLPGAVHPGFSEEEVDRLARRLAMTEPHSDTPWTTRTTPCPFLKGNLCSVYEDRPADCSGYPYLYEPEFVYPHHGND